MDLFFNESGDIERSHSGDVALTQTNWRDDVQAAYIRIMTDQGDYTLYPDLGATLSRLYGMPQSPETGEEGKALIISALKRDSRFEGFGMDVDSIPTGPQSIRFDVKLLSGSRRRISLSVEQDLGLLPEE